MEYRVKNLSGLFAASDVLNGKVSIFEKQKKTEDKGFQDILNKEMERLKTTEH